MSRRAAVVTQADISRAIRAMVQEGFPTVRVLVKRDGVSVEPFRERPRDDDEDAPNDEREIVVL